MQNLRADLYHYLAEAFANPPDWLALAGSEWYLYEIASRLNVNSECLKRLAAIPAEPFAVRLARYNSLFIGIGRPRFWLYESANLNRMLGPETFAVAKIYREAGLETVGAELPDHISNELAFLSYLAVLGQDEIFPEEKKFIETHAGRWLPHLGRTLAQSGDEVYAPLGELLSVWMEESASNSATPDVECESEVAARLFSSRIPKLPVVTAGQCTLCGFCVQACLPRVLRIYETQNITALILKAEDCIHCGKCERICERQALKMQSVIQVPAKEWIALHQSPRVLCQHCKQPMVSQAEFNFVTTQIGHPTWLDYCSECRTLV